MPTKHDLHTIYKNAAGKRLASVTTILGILDKPALKAWAYNLGREGKDMKAVMDSAMSTGTLMHYLIACELKKETPEQSYLDEFSKHDRNYADNCLIKWYEWCKDKVIEVVACETSMVSEKFQYGGTFDLLAYINGKLCLCDLKSSNGVWPEYWYQLAAYETLIDENLPDLPMIEQYHILRFGKDESMDDFEDKQLTDLDTHWQIFHYALQIYKLQNALRRGE